MRLLLGIRDLTSKALLMSVTFCFRVRERTYGLGFEFFLYLRFMLLTAVECKKKNDLCIVIKWKKILMKTENRNKNVRIALSKSWKLLEDLIDSFELSHIHTFIYERLYLNLFFHSKVIFKLEAPFGVTFDKKITFGSTTDSKRNFFLRIWETEKQ